jgi:peptide/nickel transport system ATP-binding protein
MAMLMISHDLGLMQDQVDQVMVMYGGSVVESAQTADLFAHRAHPYTRGLFAARPRLGMARGTRLATIAGSVPELADLPPGCAFSDRCNLAVPACKAEPPAKFEVGSPDHWVRCPFWSQP